MSEPTPKITISTIIEQLKRSGRFDKLRLQLSERLYSTTHEEIRQQTLSIIEGKLPTEGTLLNSKDLRSLQQNLRNEAHKKTQNRLTEVSNQIFEEQLKKLLLDSINEVVEELKQGKVQVRESKTPMLESRRKKFLMEQKQKKESKQLSMIKSESVVDIDDKSTVIMIDGIDSIQSKLKDQNDQKMKMESEQQQSISMKQEEEGDEEGKEEEEKMKENQLPLKRNRQHQHSDQQELVMKRRKLYKSIFEGSDESDSDQQRSIGGGKQQEKDQRDDLTSATETSDGGDDDSSDSSDESDSDSSSDCEHSMDSSSENEL